MTLHSPPLERRLRKAARQSVRTSATLRREAKRLRRARSSANSSGGGVVARLMASGMLIGVMAAGTAHNVSFQYHLAIIALWGAMSVGFQAGGLAARLYNDAFVSPLLLLPVPDHIIFRWQTQTFLRKNLAAWIDGAAAFTFLAVVSGLEPNKWVIVPLFATAQWLIILGLAAASVAYRPRLPRFLQLMLPVLLLVFVLLLVDRKFVGPRLALWIDATSSWLTLVLPTGWPAILFDRALMRHDWLSLVLAGPIALIFGLAFQSWKHLRRHYKLNATLNVGTPLPTSDENEPPDQIPLPQQAPLIGPTELLDGIHAREFLRPFSLESPGPLERFVFDRLTARDKLLVETMAAEHIRWSKRWRNAALFLAGGMTVSWLLQRLGAVWFGWVDAFALMVAAVLSLITSIRVRTALPAALPVSVAEIARLKMKLAFGRCVTALPLFVAYGALLAWRIGESPGAGASVGAKAIALLLAVVPFHVVASISSGTNDTKITRLHSLWMIAVLLICVLVILGFGVAAVIADFANGAFWAGWACVAAVAVTSWLFLVYYQRQFNRCRFDVTQLFGEPAASWQDSDG
jgi:hypothetical protein